MEFFSHSPAEGAVLIWTLTVTGILGLTFALTRFRLNKMELKLQQRLERLKTVSTIETDSPLDDDGDSFREQEWKVFTHGFARFGESFIQPWRLLGPFSSRCRCWIKSRRL